MLPGVHVASRLRRTRDWGQKAPDGTQRTDNSTLQNYFRTKKPSSYFRDANQLNGKSTTCVWKRLDTVRSGWLSIAGRRGVRYVAAPLCSGAKDPMQLHLTLRRQTQHIERTTYTDPTKSKNTRLSQGFVPSSATSGRVTTSSTRRE